MIASDPSFAFHVVVAYRTLVKGASEKPRISLRSGPSI